MPKSFFTLILDAELEQGVIRLRRTLSDAGIGQPPELRHRPHVTLAGFDLADPSRCVEPLRHLCSRHAPVPIRLHHIGLFPERSVLFLQPRMTGSLTALHRAAIEELGPALESPPTSANFAIGSWTPHCTLVESVPRELMGAAVRLLQEHWRVLEGHAVGVGVLIPPDIIDRFRCDLAGSADAVTYP
jgi:2'-5' RNA ligase